LDTGEEAPLDAETVKLMLTESVTSILSQCAAQLHRDTKDVGRYGYEGFSLQFTTLCSLVTPLIGAFKNQQIAVRVLA